LLAPLPENVRHVNSKIRLETRGLNTLPGKDVC
jgi:hypothetical protein